MNMKNKIPDLFRSIDAQDLSGFLGFLDDNVYFRFGNMPEVQGKDNVKVALQGFYESIDSLSHQIDEILDKKNELLACNGTVTYTRHNSSTLTVPFANFFRIRNNLISDYNIYVDISELYK
jgi:ketosteroid isomerase-like protein